jgi:hypothetical protein
MAKKEFSMLTSILATFKAANIPDLKKMDRL